VCFIAEGEMRANLTILPDETTSYRPFYVFENAFVRIINNCVYYVHKSRPIHHCSCTKRNFFTECGCESYKPIFEKCEGFVEVPFEGILLLA
jgi:hypothetical protein